MRSIKVCKKCIYFNKPKTFWLADIMNLNLFKYRRLCRFDGKWSSTRSNYSQRDVPDQCLCKSEQLGQKK